MAQFTFVHNGNVVETLDAAESTHADGVWVRPDGVPFANQDAASDPTFRHTVEASIVWAAAHPDSPIARWGEVETRQVDGRWVHPNGAEAASADPKLRALHDRLTLVRHRPLTADEAARLGEFADREQAGSSTSSESTVIL